MEHSEKVKFEKLTVIFLTETNEGRTTDPYFSQVEIDICNKCKEFMLKNRRYITAVGAMGYNKYSLK